MEKILYILVVLSFILFADLGCTAEPNREEFRVNNRVQDEGEVRVPVRYDTLENVTAYAADSAAPYEITFTEVASFRGHPLDEFEKYRSEKVLVGRTGLFAVDESDKVYSVNGHSIHVFDSGAELITTLGGSGRGSGEFSNMTGIIPNIRDKKLYAYDEILHRLNVFDTRTLELSRTSMIDPGMWAEVADHKPTDIIVYSDSLLLMKFSDSYQRNRQGPYFSRYYAIDIDKETISNEIFTYRLDEEKSPILFLANGQTDWPFPNPSGRYMQVAFGPDNHIYATRTDDFLIKVYLPQGEYLRAIYYPYENRPLNEQDIIESQTNHRERAEEHEFPETWPAIDQIFVDDEKRIWVATITEDENNYEWWILKNSGELMATFTWPGRRLDRHDMFRVDPKVRNGFFYDKRTDSTSGITEIVKYRIDFRER